VAKDSAIHLREEATEDEFAHEVRNVFLSFGAKVSCRARRHELMTTTFACCKGCRSSDQARGQKGAANALLRRCAKIRRRVRQDDARVLEGGRVSGGRAGLVH